MSLTAHSLYGGAASVQPTSTPTPDHGTAPTPMARTTAAVGGRTPVVGNPTMLLVLLLAAAIGLVHVSVRVG